MAEFSLRTRMVFLMNFFVGSMSDGSKIARITIPNVSHFSAKNRAIREDLENFNQILPPTEQCKIKLKVEQLYPPPTSLHPCLLKVAKLYVQEFIFTIHNLQESYRFVN